MRKLGITLSAAAFVLGSMVLTASAQTQSAGAGSMPRAAKWVRGPK